jgi:glycosyltransferase involved in cell wall biosynthesis
MHIGIIIRENDHVWGGDLKVTGDLKTGLEALGCRITVSQFVLHLLDVDFIILTNSVLDLRSHFDILQLYKIPYAVLCFHEDTIQYTLACFGFANYLEKCLEGYVENGVAYSLDRLLATPHIVNYFGFSPLRSPYYNHSVLEQAQVCIVNSTTEEKTLLRDCPAAKSEIVSLSPGRSSELEKSTMDSFMEFAHLSGEEYILQVGRFETRKNQLASILATRHFNAPLVFITTNTHQPWYEKLCLKAIQTYRSHPTIVISESLDNARIGALIILKMPNGKKLSPEMLESAYCNAGLYLHPAFCEVPGLVYFEAARFGIPIIASEWCTIKDTDLAGTEYPLPFDVPAIESRVQKLFGKKQNAYEHAIFSRTTLDYAKDVLGRISAS